MVLTYRPSRVGGRARTFYGCIRLHVDGLTNHLREIQCRVRLGTVREPAARVRVDSGRACGRTSSACRASATLRYGDVGTIRRIGALLEREGANTAVLRQLARTLRPSAGLIPWISRRPKRGTIDRRWGIVWNDRA